MGEIVKLFMVYRDVLGEIWDFYGKLHIGNACVPLGMIRRRG